jgi:hypothetical protein
VSRLYDRVMAQGCRPLRLAYLFGKGTERDRREYEALKAAEPRIETDALEVLSRTDLESAEIFAADDAGHYVAALPWDTSLNEIVGPLVPPFPRTWVEFQGVPNQTNALSWGILFEDLVPVSSVNFILPNFDVDEMGWAVRATLVCEWQRGHPVGPVIRAGIALGRDGSWLPTREGKSVFRGELAKLPFHAPGDEQFVNELVCGPLIGPGLFAISLLHCKNVRVRNVTPPPKLAKKAQKKHGRPLVTYRVLEIDAMRRILDSEGEAQTKGLRHALHICRGHFKTFTEDAPLFGKHAGTYWWPAQVRGSSAEGIVEKDYRIRLDGDGLGQSYRHADEEVIVAPAEVKPNDPDTSQRGLRAHNATQNLLARHLEEAGLSPRSPRAGEPAFDLAWEDGETTWVAEVKSTTASNEGHQMHMAVGQVMHYRQQLAAEGRDVRAMIAVENPPFDKSFVELCGTEEIALVWPEVMARALGSSPGATELNPQRLEPA